MKIKASYIIIFFILMIMIFMIWVFSNKAITDHCSDLLIHCVQKEVNKSGLDKISGGFSCMFDNLVCVFSRIPEGMK